MKLTEDQRDCLIWFVRRGGSGIVDRYGRVAASGETRPQGSWVAWLRLVALGLIEGGDRRLTLTYRGRMTASQAEADQAEIEHRRAVSADGFREERAYRRAPQ